MPLSREVAATLLLPLRVRSGHLTLKNMESQFFICRSCGTGRAWWTPVTVPKTGNSAPVKCSLPLAGTANKKAPALFCRHPKTTIILRRCLRRLIRQVSSFDGHAPPTTPPVVGQPPATAGETRAGHSGRRDGDRGSTMSCFTWREIRKTEKNWTRTKIPLMTTAMLITHDEDETVLKPSSYPVRFLRRNQRFQ